jgi:hypothetical protein
MLGEHTVNNRSPRSDTMTHDLVQTWVSVTDADGRTRLEARWTPVPHSGAPEHVVPAA